MILVIICGKCLTILLGKITSTRPLSSSRACPIYLLRVVSCITHLGRHLLQCFLFFALLVIDSISDVEFSVSACN